MKALNVFKVFVVLVHISVAVTTNLRSELFGPRKDPLPSMHLPSGPMKNQMILCGLCRISTGKNLTECNRLCLSSVKGHDWPQTSSLKLIPFAPSNKTQFLLKKLSSITNTKRKLKTTQASFSSLSSATSQTPIPLQDKNDTDLS